MNKNKRFPRNDKGTLLMHTVVLSVVMAMMGTMMLKWATNRYELVSKARRQMRASMVAESCLAQKMSGWLSTPLLPGSSSDMSCSVVLEGGGTSEAVEVPLSTYVVESSGGDSSYGLIISITQDIL
ncbi:MAG TPA: hypothetical protein PLL10_09055 [Elusimicrobiales bacterium]|nr:hypothetical protein [Elusimicrobiales bacterium]